MQTLEGSMDGPQSVLVGLLRNGETEVPGGVRKTVEFLSSLDLWWELSRNHEALSCRDAARKRRRLGHEGIELWNELKSYFGRFCCAEGRHQYFLAHCRGDRAIHAGRLAGVLQAQGDVVRVEDDELARLGLRYGVVNPFETWSVSGDMRKDGLVARPVLQVFDTELTQRIGVPGTMMTNAGDLTWAVEFDIVEFIAKIDGALVARIAEPDPENDATLWGAREIQTIGILTGNAPESGMHLWNDVNWHVRDILGPMSCGDVSMPPAAVLSLPALGLTMELDRREQEIWPHLRKSVIDACESGVRILAIACHTTHYFTPQIRAICEKYGTVFVSVAEVLGEWLRYSGIRELALVGIRHVSNLDEWSAYREPLRGLRVERLSDRAKELLDELAYQVKTQGATHSGLNRLRDILQKEVRSHTVVLALTELSMLLSLQRKKGRSGRRIIDPLALYAEAIARRYLGLSFPEDKHNGRL